jgi:ribosomal protein L23
VKPAAVRIVRVSGKRSWTRGTNRFGRGAAGKKAYVYLKKGDTIELS